MTLTELQKEHDRLKQEIRDRKKAKKLRKEIKDMKFKKTRLGRLMSVFGDDE